MLEPPNFDHITTFTIQFDSRVKISGMKSWKKHDVITLISKYFIYRNTRVGIFSDTIKIATTFIKAIFKKLKRIRNYVSKYNLYLCFFI